MDLAGLGCTLAYGALAWLAHRSGGPDVRWFLALAGWSALLTFALYAYHAKRQDVFLSVGRLVFWALAFRICGLFGGPLFEDDFHRYLWDAHRFAEDLTPYGPAPEAYFDDASVPDAFAGVLDQVNNPDLPTIYGPVAQFAFLAGYFLAPAKVWPLQAIFIAFDIGIVLLLLRLAPARAVLLYAWCPLVVKEIAFTAHPESLGVCLLVAAVVLARAERLRAAAVCLALAAGAKVFALLLVPFVLMRARVGPWMLFAGVLAALYLPFIIPSILLLGQTLPEQALPGQTGAAVGMASTATMALAWEFNAALFALFAALLPNVAARVAAGAALIAFCAWCWMRQRRLAEAVPRGDWVFGALLLLAPVVNPWYLIWVLPFAVVHRSAWAWTASLAVLLSYLTGLNLDDTRLHPYGHPWWVRPLEFGLVALAFGWDLWRRFHPGAPLLPARLSARPRHEVSAR